ncbi:glutaredoxin domain-containing protein [Ectobacillus polymachus]|uniref:glutaredoxin domain-containing protein n=1 Tax=Ectobacillus polymachus TaxID=1508806 RepID=UPI003A8A61E2
MKEVQLYSQPDCPPCEILKMFFKHYSISYTEYNIATDDEAKNRLLNHYHSLSTPTVVIDGVTVIGLEIDRIKQLLTITE